MFSPVAASIDALLRRIIATWTDGNGASRTASACADANVEHGLHSPWMNSPKARRVTLSIGDSLRLRVGTLRQR